MSLRSPAENENTSFVMPARIAGIQVPKDASGTSVSTWIPAIHAGMTQCGALLELSALPQPAFSKEILNATSPSPVSGEGKGEGSEQNSKEV